MIWFNLFILMLFINSKSRSFLVSFISKNSCPLPSISPDTSLFIHERLLFSVDASAVSRNSLSTDLLVVIYLMTQHMCGALPIAYILYPIVVAALLLLAYMDWYYFILPDPYVFLVFVTGLSVPADPFGLSLCSSLITGLICYLLLWLIDIGYYLIKGRNGLGRGEYEINCCASGLV